MGAWEYDCISILSLFCTSLVWCLPFQSIVTNEFSWCLAVSLEISLEWRPNPECIWMGILLEWITCSRFGFKRELDNISWVCGRRQHFSNSARPSNLGTKFFTKQNNFSTLAQSNGLFWQRGDERENKLKNLLEHQKIQFWRISPLKKEDRHPS